MFRIAPSCWDGTDLHSSRPRTSPTFQSSCFSIGMKEPTSSVVCNTFDVRKKHILPQEKKEGRSISAPHRRHIGDTPHLLEEPTVIKIVKPDPLTSCIRKEPNFFEMQPDPEPTPRRMWKNSPHTLARPRSAPPAPRKCSRVFEIFPKPVAEELLNESRQYAHGADSSQKCNPIPEQSSEICRNAQKRPSDTPGAVWICSRRRDRDGPLSAREGTRTTSSTLKNSFRNAGEAKSSLFDTDPQNGQNSLEVLQANDGGAGGCTHGSAPTCGDDELMRRRSKRRSSSSLDLRRRARSGSPNSRFIGEGMRRFSVLKTTIPQLGHCTGGPRSSPDQHSGGVLSCIRYSSEVHLSPQKPFVRPDLASSRMEHLLKQESDEHEKLQLLPSPRSLAKLRHLASSNVEALVTAKPLNVPADASTELHRADAPRTTRRRPLSAPSVRQIPAFITGLRFSPLGGERLTRLQQQEQVAMEQLKTVGDQKAFVFPEKVVASKISSVDGFDDMTSSALNLLTAADMRSVGKSIGETNRKLEEPLYHCIVEAQRPRSTGSKGRRRDRSKDVLQPILRSIRNNLECMRPASDTNPFALSHRVIASKPDSPHTPPTTAGKTTPVTDLGWPSNNSTPSHPS